MDQKSNQGNTARRHHFLSQFYLKRFTPLGTNESKLCVLNLSERQSFHTTPSNVALLRDFNRIEKEGLEPNYLESQLSDFEGSADQAIRNIEYTGVFEGEDRVIILNLMALFAVRSPYIREYWQQFREDTTKMILSMAAKNVGGTTNGVLITPDFKKFVEEDQFEIVTHQNEHIEMEMKMLDPIIQLLARRKWTLIHAQKDLTFITNDRPVTLSWKKYGPVGNPGFGSLNSQIYFPLTKKIALVGDFEEDNGANIVGQEKLVGSINSGIFSNAALWLYIESGNFVFLNHRGELYYDVLTFWDYLESLINCKNYSWLCSKVGLSNYGGTLS